MRMDEKENKGRKGVNGEERWQLCLVCDFLTLVRHTLHQLVLFTKFTRMDEKIPPL